jgi:hypothetical protein
MSMVARNAPSTKTSRTAQLVLGLVAFAFFFLMWCRFGAPPVSTDDLDPSWTSALGYAFRIGLRWGHDIVYSYGPLGFLHPGATRWGPLADIYWWSQIALAFAQAFVAAMLFASADMSRRIALVVVALACSIGVAGDVLWFVVPAFALAAMLYRASDASSRAALAVLVTISSIYVAAISCIKVSLMPLVPLWWFAAIAVLLLHRRRGAALLCLIVVPVAFLSIWLLAGQRIGDIPGHVIRAAQVSVGYAHGMGVFPRLTIEIAGALTLAACGLTVLHALWQHRRNLAALIVVAYFGVVLLLAWRTGFTRADLHTIVFFACAAFLAPQLPRITGAVLRPFGIPALVIALFSLVVFVRLWQVDAQQPPGQLLTIGVPQIRNNWELLRNRHMHDASFEALAKQTAEKYALPRIAAEIGTHSVDLVGYQQSVLEFNRFNYTPRPVFQSYKAYIRPLARMNEDFLLGERAPDYVMLPFSPIDGHLVTIEDPLSILALLRRYTPVLVESKYLLLKKAAPVAAPFEVRAPATTAMLGDWIDVPAGSAGTVLSYSVHLSLAGKIVSALLREPIWFIEIGLDDGTTQRLRTTRDAGESGFLVTPFVASLNDWVRLFMREPMPRVTRMRLLPQRDELAFLTQREFTFAFTPLEVDQLPPRPDSAQLDSLMYPGFRQRPTSTEGIVNPIEENGRPALFAHSPSMIAFDVEAGAHVVEGEIGIRAEALSSPTCAQGDGVALLVQVGDGPAQPVIRLNPFARNGEPNPARFRSAVFTADAKTTLRLRVDPGETGNTACDWAYLRDVAIVPANATAPQP